MKGASFKNLICGNGASVTDICIDPSCQSYCMQCGNQGCSCRTPHQGHPKLDFASVLQRISSEQIIPPVLKHAEKVLLQILKEFEARTENLRKLSQEYLNTVAVGSGEFAQVRKKLLADQPLTPKESTGSNIAAMLQGIGKGSKETTYKGLTGQHLEMVLSSVISTLGIIESDVKTAWGVLNSDTSSNTLRTKQVSSRDIEALPPTTSIIELTLCFSEDWKSIEKALTRLPNLRSLVLQDCNTGDALFSGISECKQLRRVQMSTT